MCDVTTRVDERLRVRDVQYAHQALDDIHGIVGELGDTFHAKGIDWDDEYRTVVDLLAAIERVLPREEV